MQLKNTEEIHRLFLILSESQDNVFSIQIYLYYYFTFEKYEVKKNHLFVPTPSEEILAIGTPITRPNNSTVHSSYLVGEGEEAENWV